MAIDPTGRHLYVVGFQPSQGILSPLKVTVLPYRIDPATGALTPIGTGTQFVNNNASALTVDPSGRYLYMLNSLNDTAVDDGVMALAIDQSSGSLAPLGSQISTSGAPSAILSDPSGRFVYVANSLPAAVAPTSGATWPDFVSFAVSTDHASAGQLVQTGAGPLSTASAELSSISMAIVE